jgi:P-type conjugative transfer protein TrbJ
MPMRWNISRRKIAAFGAAVLLAASPVRRSEALWGGFDPIIFDPKAFAQHVQQVQEALRQVAALKEQVQNQLKSLADLGASAKGLIDMKGELAGVRSQFDSAMYSVRDAGGQLAGRFPRDMGDTTPAQYHAFEETWTREYRAALEENRRLQNSVFGRMAGVRQQVGTIVEASNAASGEKAAVQAHNQLLATLSGELAKLEALRVSRMRTKAETLARRQSEAAYGAAQGQAVLRGIGDHAAAGSTPIINVFVTD